VSPNHDSPTVSLAEALDHSCAGAAVPERARAWWLAVHAALVDPTALTPRQRAELPAPFRDVVGRACDDTVVEGWLESPEFCDRVWSVGSHCPHDRHLVAHLLMAAAQGSPPAIAEFLLRDLLRMSAIVGSPDDEDPWGGHFAAAVRVDEALTIARRCGVARAPFRDLYDSQAGATAGLRVDAVCWQDIRLGAAGVWHVAATAQIDDVVLVDAGGLYDRLIMRVETHVRPTVLAGTELVSGLPCRLEQVDDQWVFAVELCRHDPIPVLYIDADDIDDDWEFPLDI
jgi:hypothetical protein